jgi:hypothetical protein
MQEIVDKINALKLNFKAETVISDLIGQGFNAKDFIIEFAGNHKQNWDKDVLGCEERAGKLVLKVSRNGFLRSLPEYLFLKPVESLNDEKQNILEFNTEQENSARILFNPIENEIFYQRVCLDHEENEVLGSLAGSSFVHLTQFWKLDTEMDDQYKVKFAKVIPFLYSIVGDFKITSKYLEYFIEDTVHWTVEQRMKQVKFEENNTLGILGSSSCGINLVSNGLIPETTPVLIFTIGPIEKADITNYLEQGKKQKLIKWFYNYFIPVEFDIDLVYKVSETEDEFFLDQSYLGFDTVLN